MSLIIVDGKNHIQAELLAYTKGVYSPIATFRVRFHRYVAEQFLKHRMFSCNAISSRAMTVPKMNDWVDKYPAVPLFWGARQKGMQPSEECRHSVDVPIINKKEYTCEFSCELPDTTWHAAKDIATFISDQYWQAGYHQQIPNRLTHPFQMAEYIVTATDWDNFFNLRLHDDAAQSEITELARCMKECFDRCKPQEGYFLKRGNFNIWHLPMIKEEEINTHFSNDLLILSAARCAVISYNNHDTGELMGIDQAKKIYNHLLSDTNPHYTPVS